MTIKLEKLTTLQLLQNYVRILEELKARRIIRTSNSPIGDYTEWLVANTLGLKLENNSKSGYDAVEPLSMVKFQIKGRRVTARNPSRQLGAIRNLNSRISTISLLSSSMSSSM